MDGWMNKAIMLLYIKLLLFAVVSFLIAASCFEHRWKWVIRTLKTIFTHINLSHKEKQTFSCFSCCFVGRPIMWPNKCAVMPLFIPEADFLCPPTWTCDDHSVPHRFHPWALKIYIYEVRLGKCLPNELLLSVVKFLWNQEFALVVRLRLPRRPSGVSVQLLSHPSSNVCLV